ncbi:sugar phosphate isomerase/epimerase family protein [Pedosphaera parvula]|nr:sugar phosphate isomerase/epimerase [Pedosphaera parvula]
MSLKNRFLGGVACAASLVALNFSPALLAEPIPASCKVGDFVVGCQAYTFNRFSVMEAIEKTAQAGGTVIEFYPGQKLSPEQPKAKWDHNASPETIKMVKDQLAKYHIRPVSYGVVYPKGGEAEWRKIFDFAKEMGLYSITTESVGELDLIEKLVKEYDIKVGIHEHKKRPDDANYKIWDPNYVLSLVKDRDARIGACADTGHWASSGVTPLEGIKILKGRIVSLHLKERTEIGKQLPDAIYGTGVSNIKGILDELKDQKFEGPIDIEYENNWDHSVPDVAQCIGFVRGYSTAK